MDNSKEVKQIPIDEIIPNRFQPRINFDEKALDELSNSIKQHGIIQPLVLRPLGDKFEIIAGERRYKAATLAGLQAVPAIITEMDDSTSAEVALVENVQRKNLSSIEEAKSYKNMLDRGNMTQEELAKKMGLSQSTIANKLRLLNLSQEVQDALMKEKISERHARSLLTIQDKDEQIKWLNRIINERLTVRQLDLAIKDEKEEKKQEEENDIPIVDINPDIQSIIDNAVDINPKQEEKKIDVFSGINVDNNQVINNEIKAPNEETIEEPVKPMPINNGMPNKFFNFLEDEEVNMNMEEPKEEVKENVPLEQNSTEEIFSFTPEFTDAEENKEIPEDKNNFAAFNSAIEQNNAVEESINNSEEIDSLDDEPLVQNNIELTNDSVEETVINEQPTEKETIVEEPKEEVKETPVETVNNDASNNSEFIFDDEPELMEEIKENVETETSEPINNEEEKTEEIVDVEPIPVMEGENIYNFFCFFFFIINRFRCFSFNIFFYFFH